jgi:molybdate transport system substrate-binding protein
MMAEIRVMLTAAFKSAYLELVPRFERETGHTVTSIWVSTVDIMRRVKSAEAADVVIASAGAIDALIDESVVARGDRVDIATCGIALAVRAGAPKPGIGSGDALKRAMLDAKSIVYSTGPSGVYLAKLFERMGIAREIAPKVKIAQGEPTGAVVARGEAEIAFQQMSELLPVQGIDIVGPLSADVQETTVFSAGVIKASSLRPEAEALLAFFTAPSAAPVIERWGMQPLGRRVTKR